MTYIPNIAMIKFKGLKHPYFLELQRKGNFL